jgi:hypothetical protein
MLSVHKEGSGVETVPSSPNLMLSSFGKVVGSIEGLRHKLDNLTLSDLEATEEKINTLSERLGELHRTVLRLSAIREQLLRVDAAKNEAGNETARVVELATLQKPLKLHMLGQLRSLVLFSRANRGLSDAGGLKEYSHDIGEVPEAKAIAEPSRTTGVALAETAAAPEVLSAPDSDSTELSLERLHDSVHQDLPASNREHVFHGEPLPAASGTEALLSADKPVSQIATAGKTAQAEIESVEAEEFILTEIGETNPVTVQWRELPEAPASVSPENQTASEFEFDQRLLNDLIKDYGEFIVPSPSSSSAEAAPPPKRPESSLAKSQTEFPLVDNVTSQKILPSARKDGELDRKLKKLIKDYGEYDLYSGHSSKKYGTRIIAICAIIAVFLGGIYFFSSEENETATDAPAVIQRDSGARNSAEPRKEDAGVGPRSHAGSSAPHDHFDQNASPGPGTGSKPFANNNKNNEKVGR